MSTVLNCRYSQFDNTPDISESKSPIHTRRQAGKDIYRTRIHSRITPRLPAGNASKPTRSRIHDKKHNRHRPKHRQAITRQSHKPKPSHQAIQPRLKTNVRHHVFVHSADCVISYHTPACRHCHKDDIERPDILPPAPHRT